MEAEILEFKSKKFEPVKDAKGRPIAGLTRHIPSGMIHIRKTFKKLGIPTLSASTGETTLGRAQSKANVLIQRHMNKHLGINDSHVFGRQKISNCFQEVALEVLELYTPKTRPATQEKHKQFINELISEWGQWDPNTITPSLFEQWIERLRRTKTRKSFEDYSKHMNLVMRWGYERMKVCTHLIKFENPDKELIKTRKGRVYSDEEIMRVWDALNPTTQDQFILSYECMMRLREVLRLTWDRVDIRTGKITLRPEDVKTGSKTGKGREFFLSEDAHKRLKIRYAKRNPKSPYLFPSPRNIMKPVNQNKTAWKLAKEAAGIRGKATWHHLRHTALSKAFLNRNADKVRISRYAGVSLQTIDRVYLKATASDTKEVRSLVSIPNKTGCEQGANGGLAND